MKILAVDTATKFLCLGIYDDGKVYEYNLEAGRQLSSLLSPTIKRLLEAVQIRASEIHYFACGLGPGSFTGLRIGLAYLKGLSWVTRRPLAGISTLDILASGIKDTDKTIIPIIDAKRDLVYCSAFKNKNGRLLKIKPYLLLNKKELLATIKPNSIILGDAISLYREEILAQIKGVSLLDQDYWYPQAHNIISLAQQRIKDKKFDSPFRIKPIYLYPKECQIRK